MAVFLCTVRDWTSSPQKQYSLYCVGVTITAISLVGAATIMIFVATKVLSCPKFCHNKCIFVITKHIFCRNKNTLVTTKLWSQQQTNICRNKHNFVTTKLWSQQAYFCHDKHAWFSEKRIMFFVTKLLSWQKWYLWKLPPMIVPKPTTAACSANQSAGHTDYRNGNLPLHRHWTSPPPPPIPPQKQCSLCCLPPLESSFWGCHQPCISPPGDQCCDVLGFVPLWNLYYHWIF